MWSNCKSNILHNLVQTIVFLLLDNFVMQRPFRWSYYIRVHIYACVCMCVCVCVCVFDCVSLMLHVGTKYRPVTRIFQGGVLLGLVGDHSSRGLGAAGAAPRHWQQSNIWCPLTTLNLKYDTNDSNELVYVLIWLLNWSFEVTIY